MKKPILISLLALTLFSFTFHSLGYMTLFENSNSAKYFKYGKHHFIEYFDNDKKTFNDLEYYVRYRKYSWGDVDTAYYRKADTHYYHFDSENMTESITLPVEPQLGDKWYEADESWSYEVIETDLKFKTPAKKYKNCVKVHCLQLANRDKNKRQEYFLFYSPEFGYVGNVDSKGKILSYLSEMKIDAKEGEVIGEKSKN